jgi:hypothetical protein
MQMSEKKEINPSRNNKNPDIQTEQATNKSAKISKKISPKKIKKTEFPRL